MKFKDQNYNFTMLQVPILLPPTVLRPLTSWPASDSMAALRTLIGSVACELLEATSSTPDILSLLLSGEIKAPQTWRKLNSFSQLVKLAKSELGNTLL